MKLLGLFLLPSSGLLWPLTVPQPKARRVLEGGFQVKSPGKLEQRGNGGDGGRNRMSYSSKFSPSRFTPQTGLLLPPQASLFGFLDLLN